MFNVFHYEGTSPPESSTNSCRRTFSSSRCRCSSTQTSSGLAICEILGVNKLGYHPQCDGLVEKFNSTLIDLIAKCCENRKHDWDTYLPMLMSIFCPREYLWVSIFHGLWLRPSHPHIDAVANVDPDYYKTELVVGLGESGRIMETSKEIYQEGTCMIPTNSIMTQGELKRTSRWENVLWSTCPAKSKEISSSLSQSPLSHRRMLVGNPKQPLHITPHAFKSQKPQAIQNLLHTKMPTKTRRVCFN